MEEIYYGSALASASVSVIGIGAAHITERGRIKFVYGERHVLEHLAGIVCGGGNTFLFGNGIFGSVDEILRGTFNANNGKEAEGDGKQLFGLCGAESAADAAANVIGEIFCGKAGIAATFANLHDLGIQNDGVGNLKDRCGEIRFGKIRIGAIAEILMRGAFEDIDVALTAVENDFLFDDGDAFDLLRSAKAGANLRDDLYVHGDADLIKAAVEGDAVNIDIGADDLRILGTHAAAAFDQLVSHVGKINGNVFKAIFITAAIKNSIGVYIYRVTGTAARRRIVSGIWHNG